MEVQKMFVAIMWLYMRALSELRKNTPKPEVHFRLVHAQQ